MTNDDIEAAALVIASGGRLDMPTALASVKAERNRAGCNGDCAETLGCKCSHSAAPRIPLRPVPVQFCGYGRRPPLWRRLWRWLTGPRP